MAYWQIPEGSTELQTGLWLHTVKQIIGTVEYTFRYLYSGEGYCFYDKTEEIWKEDENGNLYQVPESDILPADRTYMQYMSVGLSKDINDLVSVTEDSTYEIVNKPNNNEVA